MCCRRLLVAALLCGVVPLNAQTSVSAAQQALLKLSATDMGTTIPTSVQNSILVLKQALVEQTDAVLANLPATGAVPARQALIKALPAETVGTLSDAERTEQANSSDDKPVAGMFGGGLHVEVTQPHAGLLFVVERFKIVCGDDNLLLVYREAGGRWHRILRWDSGRYGQISGAFGDTYETRLLKPVRNGHQLLLVVHGTPWCTSTMSSFSMDVIELGDTGSTPVWHGKHGYRRADDDPPLTLRTTTDGFEVRTSVSFGSGGDTVSRKGIMRYVVRGGGVQRTLPIAPDAIGTLDEWLSMPRMEARGFADAPAGALTWAMYDALTWRGVKSADIDKHWTADYGAVRACSDDAKHVQISVPTTRGYGAKEQHGTTYYVQMMKVPNGYRIHAVTARPDAVCTGPDLMATH